jgi:hypothetical protein
LPVYVVSCGRSVSLSLPSAELATGFATTPTSCGGLAMGLRVPPQSKMSLQAASRSTRSGTTDRPGTGRKPARATAANFSQLEIELHDVPRGLAKVVAHAIDVAGNEESPEHERASGDRADECRACWQVADY